MNNTEHEKLHALGLAHSHEEGDHDHDHGHGHCYIPGGHHHVHSDAEKRAVAEPAFPGHRASSVHQDRRWRTTGTAVRC